MNDGEHQSRLDISNINGLFIDMNQIFHMAAQMTYGYGEYEDVGECKDIDKEKSFHDKIIIILEGVINDVKPKEYLGIFVDGLAPVAKIQQQRERRYRTASLFPPQPNKFDSCSISPGTPTMEKNR
jgi:5'-3' exonuclease